MANDWREFIEKLLSQVNIVNVISRYVPLKRKGNKHWGCCPFHHEKAPSFVVNEDSQYYYCFGCKESGNAISFIQKIESIERIDAIKMLADEVKMELPQSGFKEDDGKSREKRNRLFALMRDAAKHYHDNLSSPKAKNALDYIKSRQIPANLVTRFGFGVSVDGNDIIDFLESKGYTKTEMKEAGLIAQRGADWYDVFYGRFMIPIINNFGEVVAFGGRLITPETHISRKYVNSTNTLIFDKSKTLYAINLLKKKKQREKINYVIICEGYMDVLALHKAGFDTAVANMGTALTETQAKLLRNYSPNVYVSYDGDNAGQLATMRGLDILKKMGLNVKVVCLPDELDPDDLIKARGKEAYQKLLDEALTLTAYKLEVLRKRYDLTTPDGKSSYGIEAMKVIKALDNPVEQEEYLKIVHANTGYSFDALRKQADISVVEESAPVRQQEEATSSPDRDKAQLFILASVAYGKDYVSEEDDIYTLLSNEEDRRIYEYCIEKIREGQTPRLSALYDIEKPETLRAIAEYEFMTEDEESLRRQYENCVKRLKIKRIEQDKARIVKEYEQSKDAKLLMEIVKLEKVLKNLKSGADDD
ncbi:MAG: DNA primase [Clostridia bacterium]|nr:DNA primase [Clostridia bacterium]MBQ7224950.1 DNA primase [Clostridia bacterium]